MTDLRIEYLPLSRLKRHASNPKLHDSEAIARSIGAVGFADPMALDERTGQLVEGHGRLDVLEGLQSADHGDVPDHIRVDRRRPLGDQWLAPVVMGLRFANENAVRQYLLAHNRLTETGGWDDKVLANLLTELRDDQVEIIGWDEKEVDALVASLNEDLEAEAARLEDEAAGLEGFARSVTLTVEFETVDQRDATKEKLKALAIAQGQKAGTMLANMLISHGTDKHNANHIRST